MRRSDTRAWSSFRASEASDEKRGKASGRKSSLAVQCKIGAVPGTCFRSEQKDHKRHPAPSTGPKPQSSESCSANVTQVCALQPPDRLPARAWMSWFSTCGHMKSGPRSSSKSARETIAFAIVSSPPKKTSEHRLAERRARGLASQAISTTLQRTAIPINVVTTIRKKLGILDTLVKSPLIDGPCLNDTAGVVLMQ